MKSTRHKESKQQLLGEYGIEYEPFKELEGVFSQFHTPAFKSLSARKRFKKVNRALLQLIEETPEPCFLLPAILSFISRVNAEKILHEPYRMLSFEFWLNHFSHLNDEDNYKIRSKIVGKHIPREEYQLFFPIGMSKTFNGSHFVAAHFSPDIDTTIASFWGWVDAFGARLANGVHQWSLPGIFPDSHVSLLFQELFSKDVFELLVRPAHTLTLTALDLVTHKDIIKLPADTSVSNIGDTHNTKVILLVDEQGHFKGDWRANDAEVVRQVIVLFNSIMRWFENSIHSNLISILAKKTVHVTDVKEMIDSIFDMPIKQCAPAKGFTEKQKKYQDDYLKKVLKVNKGLNATFGELVVSLDTVTSDEFSLFRSAIQTFSDPKLFDEKGHLIENRSLIFNRLEKIFKELDEAILAVQNHIDRFTILLEIKEKVLEIPHLFITLKSDVEEIRTKMDNFDHLTVVVPEENGQWFPVGAVFANDLKRQTLGTVSLRDFSNENEVKMASYLEVISIVDHHKTDIKTTSAATMIVADAQSANTIVAELMIHINDRYSLLNIPKATISKELADLHTEGVEADEHLRKFKRLLQLKLNANSNQDYYVHPKREFAEYLSCLNAILDDTDLLTKVSNRDVECVGALLNRMKTISCQSDSEIISFADIPRDQHFAKNAAARILQNNDMYSIYKKIYEFKEREIELNLAACVAEHPSSIFADTKEQNGCCRVGQTKIFCTNYPFFSSYANQLRSIWLKEAKKVYETTPQIDLHIHMISTIAGADEVYSGKLGGWEHQDEIWFWVPPTQQAMERLINFLNGFQASEVAQTNAMSVQFLGSNWWELDQLFAQNFPKATRKASHDTTRDLPIAVLRFAAGLINSRKAMISPFLPRFIA